MPKRHPLLEAIYLRTGFGRRLFAPCSLLPVINIIILNTLIVFFAINAYNIMHEYQDSQINPPSSISVPDRANTLTFPSIAFCNGLADTPVLEMHITYSGVAEVSTTPISYQYNGSTYDCRFMDGSQLLAAPFGTVFSGSLEVTADIDSENSTATDPFLGMEAYMYASPGPVPQDLNISDASFDGYALLGAGIYTQISLSLVQTEVYTSEEGTATFYNYQVNAGVGPLNPRHLAARHWPVDRLTSRVLAQISYQTTQVQEVMHRPQSFSTFFGALGGWVGTCSDGWGVLTLLFVLEKFLLRLLGPRTTRAQLWWVRPQSEYYDDAAP
eukprot:jgi/Tetstr1/425793/TSEL_001576.t1